jgi:hypothetical protein
MIGFKLISTAREMVISAFQLQLFVSRPGLRKRRHQLPLAGARAPLPPLGSIVYWSDSVAM